MANDIRPLGAILPSPFVKEQQRDKARYIRQQKQQQDRQKQQHESLDEQDQTLQNDEQADEQTIEQTEEISLKPIDTNEKNVKVEHIDEYV